MPTGIVKFYNEGKGYGFIAPDDGGKDVFVHVSALKNGNIVSLDRDEKVSFEIADSPKGVKAVNVRRLDGRR
jgi:CspA family cold shock protein